MSESMGTYIFIDVHAEYDMISLFDPRLDERMQRVENIFSWICGLVLGKNSFVLSPNGFRAIAVDRTIGRNNSNVTRWAFDSHPCPSTEVCGIASSCRDTVSDFISSNNSGASELSWLRNS